MTAYGWGKDGYGASAGWLGTYWQCGWAPPYVRVGDYDWFLVAGIPDYPFYSPQPAVSPSWVGKKIRLQMSAGGNPVLSEQSYEILDVVPDSGVPDHFAWVKVYDPAGVLLLCNYGFAWQVPDSQYASVYGSAAAGVGTSILAAVALSTREVKVTLSGEPKHSSEFVVGDAFNPATWTVQRIDSGAFLIVVGVNAYSPLQYGLVVLEEFGPVTVEHRASSNTLLDVSGNLLVAPRQASFYGLLAAAALPGQKAALRVASVDIANPPLPVTAPDMVGGTLTIDGAGDYDVVSGTALLRKLILRRLITRPGDFFHLPGYGVGLAEKEPLSAGNLARFRTEIERQVRLEPDAEDVRAAVLLESSGVLTVRVTARQRTTNQAVSVTVPLQAQAVQL